MRNKYTKFQLGTLTLDEEIKSESVKRFFQNCVGGKFFEIFFWVLPRSTDQDALIELSFVKICNVGAEKKICHRSHVTSNFGRRFAAKKLPNHNPG